MLHKRKQFIDLWIAGPCQGGELVSPTLEQDCPEYYRQLKECTDELIYGDDPHMEGQKSLTIIIERDAHQVRVREDGVVIIQRDGFITSVNSNHHLELANMALAILRYQLLG